MIYNRALMWKQSGIVHDCRGLMLAFDKGGPSQPMISPVEHDLQPGIDVQEGRYSI